MEAYQECHFHWWCRRQHYLRLKRAKLSMTMITLVLVTLGIVVGPILSKAWIVAALTVFATVVKGYMDYRRYDSLMEINRFAYITYAKLISEWKQTTPEEEEWLTEWIITHHLILDLAPILPDQIKQQYEEKGQQEDRVDATV